MSEVRNDILQGPSLPSVESLLNTVVGADSREVENIRTAEKYIFNMGLNTDSQAVSIGPGQPNAFFWPNMDFIPKS